MRNLLNLLLLTCIIGLFLLTGFLYYFYDRQPSSFDVYLIVFGWGSLIYNEMPKRSPKQEE